MCAGRTTAVVRRVVLPGVYLRGGLRCSPWAVPSTSDPARPDRPLQRSAERGNERLDARIEKVDLEGSIGRWAPTSLLTQ
jgi:hypothetical protein